MNFKNKFNINKKNIVKNKILNLYKKIIIKN